MLAVLVAPFLSAAQQAPSSIEVPQGMHLLFNAKGDGAQVYGCVGGKWTLKAPDARLLDAKGNVIGSHFAGPAWKLTDGSQVKGKAIGTKAPADSTSVPWLLLQAVPGSGSGKLAQVAYIRRTETHGGAAPQSACTSGETRVPYTAMYSFYTKSAQ